MPLIVNMSRNLNFYPWNGENPQKLDDEGVSSFWYNFSRKKLWQYFIDFVLFFIIISIIYKLWIGPTWSIIQTNSNHLNFEPCAKITKILGKLCSRKVSKSKQALFDENNFMHSIIDETYKYLFSLFGQGLAFPSKQ